MAYMHMKHATSGLPIDQATGTTGVTWVILDHFGICRKQCFSSLSYCDVSGGHLLLSMQGKAEPSSTNFCLNVLKKIHSVIVPFAITLMIPYGA